MVSCVKGVMPFEKRVTTLVDLSFVNLSSVDFCTYILNHMNLDFLLTQMNT